MKTYHTLTSYMRKRLRRCLDSGEKTPDEIRHNMRELLFIEHQDELIPLLEINEKIHRTNEENGINIPYIFDVTHPSVSEVPFEYTLEYEVEYFLEQWEKRHEINQVAKKK